MSTLWTPSGERPVERGGSPSESSPPPPPTGAGAPPGTATPGHAGVAGDDLAEEELVEQMRQMQEQLAQTPAAVVVANHCIGLFQLAALHLNQDPPNLVEAQLAIDAMAAVVEGLRGRLGESEETLQDALAQLRLGFVQVKNASGP